MGADALNLGLAWLCAGVAALALARPLRRPWISLFPGERRLPVLMRVVVGTGMGFGYAALVTAICSEALHPQGISEAIVVLVLVGGIALGVRMLYAH